MAEFRLLGLRIAVLFMRQRDVEQLQRGLEAAREFDAQIARLQAMADESSRAARDALSVRGFDCVLDATVPPGIVQLRNTRGETVGEIEIP